MTLHPQGTRIVIVCFPDDCAARMTEADALALMAARGPGHNLRVYEVGWSGGYLATSPERRRATPASALARTRTVQSVERDLTVEQRQAIVREALKVGPEVAGRRWRLSKHSVQQVMQMQGHRMPSRGGWKARCFQKQQGAQA